MTKRVFIIHGYGADSESNWFPWLKEQLEEKGFVVQVPSLPNTEFPVIEEWVSAFKKLVGKLDEDTYLVGHSLGCQVIMRYLERVNEKVGGILFVAGPLTSNRILMQEEEETLGPWLTTSINLDKVKRSTNNIISIFSDDDPFVPIDNTKIFKDKLNSKIVILKHKGHIMDFVCPPVLEEFLKLSNQ